MGSGKTTVGRALAKKLNKRFIDSDHEIEARTGASIALIFEVEGEASFRQREAEVICELTQLDDIVLGTGGGAVLNPDSRAFLAARGTVLADLLLDSDRDTSLVRTVRGSADSAYP